MANSNFKMHIKFSTKTEIGKIASQILGPIDPLMIRKMNETTINASVLFNVHEWQENE